MKNKAEYIAFTVEKDCEKIEIGKQCSVRGDSLVDKILEKEAEVVQVPAEIIEQNMEETVSRFVRTLTKIDAESPVFEIDEVEFGICVGADGTISIASALNGGMNAQTTVKIKMKKREDQ